MIDDGLIPRLEAALRDDTIEEIQLRSPGGDAQISQYAGRLIRRRGLRSRIPAGWACVGACNFMFFGGTERIVDTGGVFIVQMFTTADRQAIRDEMAQGEQSTIDMIDEITQRSLQIATQDTDFLIRMGVSRRLLPDIVYRQSAAPRGSGGPPLRCLTRGEMREYRVVTD